MNDYENAKACYRRFGVDVERALARLAEKAISIHWRASTRRMVRLAMASRQQATTPAKPVILKS